VGKEVWVEAGAEAAVDDADRVSILEDVFVLDEVEPDQDAVPLPQPGAQGPRGPSAFLGVKLPMVPLRKRRAARSDGRPSGRLREWSKSPTKPRIPSPGYPETCRSPRALPP
jgi:hypothetical protein